MRTYSRRIAAMTGGDLRHPCWFMHVPKCGGTSLSEALYATVPMSKQVAVIDSNSTRRAASLIHDDRDELFNTHDDLPTGYKVYALREQFLLAHMAAGVSMIHGHVLFSDKAYRHFGHLYKYVTLLRDPVARTVSNFNGSVRGGMISNDFDAYLNSDIMRVHALSMLRYFSGNAALEPQQEDQALTLAKTNAEAFALIGFLDDLDTFCDGFQKIFGRKPRIFHYNGAGPDAYRPTSDQIAKLTKIMENEIVLWDHLRAAHGTS